ncbi:ABC transporter ATP-binding protein [Luteithermobacter gelatinilyticus]|uniref:ABC transporter ATP-binding protein n=1 Tax=Luteithermobacter gelatinilyticus TaxID=2582913 RepID=UPI0011066210|nr:ABC transporter ATP-binding protein [Luteithermobacter gelatinilyticus]|tara:strand:+ start:15877 stop:16965 length:1089 start_codon:yes stop_codon:yes gene_type:complete
MTQSPSSATDFPPHPAGTNAANTATTASKVSGKVSGKISGDAAASVDADLAIEIRGLEKVYAGGRGTAPKRALKGIDLSIPKGSIFGLLGPNGAGKSTTINILAGLVRKTAGTARIWGFDIDEHPRNAKAHIGIVPQEVYFDAFFTPREMLELQAGYYNIPKSRRRSDEILEILRLSDKANAYSRTLSGGMKRRLLVGKAMVHNPPILVLDEPTAGVDVELRQQLWDYVRDLNARGVTIVLTTHYLEEAEELCDRIAIINHGEVVICDTTPNLLRQLDEKVVIIQPATPLCEVPEPLRDLNASLREDGALLIHFSPSAINVGEILKRVQQAGIDIIDLSTRESDLEDIFLQLTRSADMRAEG